MFLFPFLKELFIGKNNSDANKNNSSFFLFIKKLIIVIGCLSFALNFYLFGKVYNLGRENLEYQNQVKEKAPKPIVYPEPTVGKKENIKVTTIGNDEQDPPEDKKNKQKPPSVPVIRDDKERLIKKLEEINKIK